MIHEHIEPRLNSKRHFIESPDPRAVQDRIDELFREFPPEGYGTFIVSNDVDVVTGVHRTVVWHANSCE